MKHDESRRLNEAQQQARRVGAQRRENAALAAEVRRRSGEVLQIDSPTARLGQLENLLGAGVEAHHMPVGAGSSPAESRLSDPDGRRDCASSVGMRPTELAAYSRLSCRGSPRTSAVLEPTSVKIASEIGRNTFST